MSIDLVVPVVGSVSIKHALPYIRTVLSSLLGGVTVPLLQLQALEDGNLVPTTIESLPDPTRPFLLVTILGEPECVGLLGRDNYVSIIMAAQRSALEYALGAAIAITLASDDKARIEDAWCFFTQNQEVTASELTKALTIEAEPTMPSDFRTPASRIKFNGFDGDY